jgi:hypothetical protein
MRRLPLLAALLLAIAAPASAQHPKTRHVRARVDTLYMLPPETIGITYCMAEGDSVYAVSAIDTRILDSLPLAVETLEHERIHRVEMQRNHALCNPLPFQLLGMEVRAYCADALYGVGRFHEPSDSAFFHRQNDLLLQFSDERENGSTVTDRDVRLAWFKECGHLLVSALAQRDGTTVTRTP